MDLVMKIRTSIYDRWCSFTRWCAAVVLEILAILYHEIGFYKKAEPLYLKALAFRAKALGTQHPDYATSMRHLASLYEEMRCYDEAEFLYLEAKDLRAKVLGKQHPDYVTSLDDLAGLYVQMQNFEKAEPLYLEAKALREKGLGKQHPDAVTSLNNLAVENELKQWKDLGKQLERLNNNPCFNPRRNAPSCAGCR
eukprot:gnl/TRDRNA2_/TRDRNA2_63136_c0_seq1.p1 gnl/TRDRNA2_/TRDRNA2_63136_c0~~gnl/TRDRNA2_/TRDRNA2_63136_c0_seq1.p1  ORF type:complete len:195 (+),score=30.80 gnl/TRDRNA2_/TRDRNA2_63136_c0_seq1:50-634(+)